MKYEGDEIQEGGWVGHVARMGETLKAYKIFVGNRVGKRLFEKNLV
jgi:hypothetical protein